MTLVPATWSPQQKAEMRWGILTVGQLSQMAETDPPDPPSPLHPRLSQAQVQHHLGQARQAQVTGEPQIRQYQIQVGVTWVCEEVRMAALTEQEVLVLVLPLRSASSPAAEPTPDLAPPGVDPLQSLVLQSIPDLLMVVRRDGTYLRFLSGGNVELFRQGQEKELMNLYDCLPPHLATQRLAVIQQALATGRQQTYEYEIQIRAEQHYEEARIVPIDADEVLVIIRDISDRKRLENALKRKVEKEHLLNQVLSKIGQHLNLKDIFHVVVEQVREFLQADRVLFYRFEPDWSGVVVAEAVEYPWRSFLGEHVVEHCLTQSAYIDAYLKGRIHQVADITDADLSPCHREFLEHWQVRANLLVPVRHNNLLYGLLATQHCQSPRAWQPWEIEVMQQIAEYFSVAITQGELYQRLQIANEELERLATTDSLTQVANRLRFDAYLSREWYRMRREKQPLALVLFDIDSFKQFNDTYGHLEGDNCLKRVAQAAAKSLKRPTDFLARYGGEEFAVLLSNTRLSGAYAVAEAIRLTVAGLQIPHQHSPRPEKVVTASFGVACLIPTLECVPNQLIQAADKALYQAKAAGRNTCFPQLSQG